MVRKKRKKNDGYDPLFLLSSSNWIEEHCSLVICIVQPKGLPSLSLCFCLCMELVFVVVGCDKDDRCELKRTISIRTNKNQSLALGGRSLTCGGEKNQK